MASLGLAQAVVPDRFPLGIADRLRADGVELVVDQRFFDDRRRTKSAAELAGIRVAQRAAEAGMAAIAALLRRSEPGPGGRVVDDAALTCELLRAAAAEEFAALGCRGDDMTVAHGAQAADGHDPGSGRARQRRCRALRPVSAALRQRLLRRHVAHLSCRLRRRDDRLVARRIASRRSTSRCRSCARASRAGRSIGPCRSFFEERGHVTQRRRRRGRCCVKGFNHGLGHGVGLELHEAPGVSRLSHALVPGDVIALEPGLYRQGFGGVRVEDLVLVTDRRL